MRNRMLGLGINIILVSVLTACGGGDNSGNTVSTVPAPQAQAPLVFEFEELTGIVHGQEMVPSNGLSGGSGSGLVRYSSSNTDVARVNEETGEVELKAGGDVTITAVKAGNSAYLEASASYTLHSIEVLNNIEVLVGETDTQIIWKQQTGSIEIYRSTEADCDIENYSVCDNGHLDIVNSVTEIPRVDSFIHYDQSAYLVLQNDQYQSQVLDISDRVAPFPRREDEAMIGFDGKLWVIAGIDNNSTPRHSDIWSYWPGSGWKQEVVSAPFMDRAEHNVLTYNGALFLIGGNIGLSHGGTLSVSDVWTSADGTTWEQISSENQSFYNTSHEAVVFNDKIWLIGGDDFIWPNIVSSTDGIEWQEDLRTAPFGTRRGHTLYVINEKLMLFGGMGPGGSFDLKNDVWSTTDGINWIQESASVAVSPRVDAKVVYYDGKLWLTGGHSFAPGHNEIYSSTDGVNWTLVATNIITSMHQTQSMAAFNDALYIYSGTGDEYLWRSEDGIDWRRVVNFNLGWVERTLP